MTPALVRELFDYDPESGLFSRRKSIKRWAAGSCAGSMRKDGYMAIKVNEKSYPAHRLAWLWMTGELPDGEIDHIDLNKSNNRWTNLRLASKSNNCANCRPRRRLGKLKGAYYRSSMNKWHAQIRAKGTIYHLGFYESEELAHAAYMAAAKVHFGEFARAA